MRMKHKREHYIPKNAVKVNCGPAASGAEVWIYEAGGAPYGLAFMGKAQKPTWHFRFKSIRQRAERIKQHFELAVSVVETREKRKADRKAEPRGLKVGDVLRSTWGYDQTNVDYYEVIRLVGKTMVEYRPIGQEAEYDGWATGQCSPVPGQFIGKARRGVARSGSVKVRSFAWANKIDVEIEGVKTYASARFSEYA